MPLRMFPKATPSSGLAFVNDYVPDHPFSVIEVLWGTRKDDVARHGASGPLAHPPDVFLYYSSGTIAIARP